MTLSPEFRNHPATLELPAYPAFYLRRIDADRDPNELFKVIEANPYLNEYQWWSRRITSPQAAKTHVEAVIERVEAGRDVQYRIVDAESDEASMIGTVALYDIKQREASMGYWLAADRQGMGYATRAAARLLTYAQSVLDLQTIHLHIARGNTDSQRVAQRLEFERVLAYRRKVRDNELPLTPGEEHIIDLWEAHL